MIAHHLPDSWVLAEATGTNPPAISLLVQTHCTLCPACRQSLAEADALAAELAPSEPVTLPAGLLDGLLDRLDEPVEPSEPPPPSPWPAPVAAVASGVWRWRFFGLREMVLDVPHDGLPVRLIWMAPGKRLFHRDLGVERGVVLQGGWTDQDGQYGAGDVYHQIEPHEPQHEQIIDPGEPCVTLVVNDAPAGLPFGLERVFKV